MKRFLELRGKFMYNAFAIPASLDDTETVFSSSNTEFFKQSDSPIGAGLYHIASYISHSCEPNCRLSFAGNKLSLVATRKLKEGDEVYVSWISREPTGSLAEKKTRRNMLKEKYRFVCRCSGCC